MLGLYVFRGQISENSRSIRGKKKRYIRGEFADYGSNTKEPDSSFRRRTKKSFPQDCQKSLTTEQKSKFSVSDYYVIQSIHFSQFYTELYSVNKVAKNEVVYISIISIMYYTVHNAIYRC